MLGKKFSKIDCCFDCNVLRELRKQSKLSLRELGNMVGIDKGNLSRLENGKVKSPPILTVFRLSKVLGVPIEFFIRSR